MHDILIKNGDIVSDNKVYANSNGIFISNGKIAGGHNIPSLNKCEIIDASGMYITPGFIDIHCHGALGADFTSGNLDDYDKISKYQASHGVTSILATMLTMPVHEIIRCLEFFRTLDKKSLSGSNVLGVYLEGPFLSAENRGAHSCENLLDFKSENYKHLLDYTDVIKMITIAPDNSDAVTMVKSFSEAGVVVSGGHDNSYEPFIYKSIEAGMTHTTHIFCAMSRMSGHEGNKYLGLTEIALLDDRLSVEIIADNYHTNKSMVQLICKCKKNQDICLVSDMLSVAGMPVGDEEYIIKVPGVEGGLKVVVDDGVAKLPDRKLNAGSITALDKMVKIMVSYGVPLEQSIQMATLNPAKIIRTDKTKGSIEAGKDADLCIMDHELDVCKTIVGGRLVYSRK